MNKSVMQQQEFLDFLKIDANIGDVFVVTARPGEGIINDINEVIKNRAEIILIDSEAVLCRNLKGINVLQDEIISAFEAKTSIIVIILYGNMTLWKNIISTAHHIIIDDPLIWMP